MIVATYISSSPIHGTGLYTAAPIVKGTKIWEHMDGLEVVVDPALLPGYPSPVQHYLTRYCYPHPTQKGKWVLDGDNGRFFNHSETPNTDFTNPMAGYALRDIAKDEELTCNYHEFAPGFEFV
ncbi:MAG: SET domain-containing protein [Rickettsiales bacterium]